MPVETVMETLRRTGFDRSEVSDQDGYVPVEVPAGAPVAVKDLVRAVEEAAEVDFNGLSAPTLKDLCEVFNRVRCTVAAIDTAFAGAIDSSGIWALSGHANARAMLKSTSNLHPYDASRRVGAANKLPRMPEAQAAFTAGLISTDHVKVLGECLARRFEPAFTEWETTLVEWAVEMDWDSFVKAIGAWKDAADQTLPDETDEADEAARGFWLSKTLNGRGELKGTLTPTGRKIFGVSLNVSSNSCSKPTGQPQKKSSAKATSR